jgi:phage terminase large subunit-like protein
MRENRIEHDGSPVAHWCIGNVVGHNDRHDNVYPNKARTESKIDCEITDIIVLGVSLSETENQQIYQGDRELMVW